MTTGPIAAGMTLYAIQREIPANNATIAIDNIDGELFLIIAPAGPIANLTIAWPSNPYPGSVVNIATTQPIGSITHTGNALNAAFGSMVATGSAIYEYDDVGATYMRLSSNYINNLYSIPYTATVATAFGSGNAGFYATSDGTSSGQNIFSSINDIRANIYNSDPNYAVGQPVVANPKVTIPVVQQVFTGVTIGLLTVLGSRSNNAAPNGTAVSCLVTGVLAS